MSVLARTCLTIAGFAAFFTGALPAEVKLQRIVPVAVMPGRTTTLTCTGTELGLARTLWTSFPAQTRKVSGPGDGPNQVTFEVTLPPTAGLGRGAVRVVTAAGISNVKLLLRDDLPNAGMTKRNTLVVPVACDGVVPAAGSSQHRMHLKAGEQLTVDLWARRLGSPLDPVVRVTDSRGRAVQALDDTPGLDGDVLLSWQVSREDDYTISVPDVSRRGGETYRYRLRLGHFVPLTASYPVFVRRGNATTVQLLGPSPSGEFPSVRVPAVATSGTVWVSGPPGNGGGSPLVPVRVAEGVETIEAEPNDDPSHAAVLEVGSRVSGFLQQAGDRDWYQLSVRKGQRLRIVGQTTSLGLPGRLYLRLCDTEGAKLAEASQDTTPERVLDYTVAADGDVRLLVEDLARRGGPGYAYHLRCTLKRPGFDLSVSTDRLHAAPGRTLSLEVLAIRRDFKGPIDVSVHGLGDAVKLEGEQVPAGKNKTTLKITLPEKFQPGEIRSLQIVGSARVDQPSEGTPVKELQSIKYNRGNLGIFDGFISDKMGGLNFAEYEVELPAAGDYLVLLKYAALKSRVAVMKLNGKVVKPGIMSQTTGSWDPKTANWFNEGLVRFPKGKSVLRLEKSGVFSHLTMIRIALPAKTDKQPPQLVRATASTSPVLRKDLAGIARVPAELDGRVFLSVGTK